jgi:hypothetical protein
MTYERWKQRPAWERVKEQVSSFLSSQL